MSRRSRPKTEATAGLAAIITARTRARPRRGAASTKPVHQPKSLLSAPLVSIGLGRGEVREGGRDDRLLGETRAAQLAHDLAVGKDKHPVAGQQLRILRRVPDQGAALAGEFAAQAIKILLRGDVDAAGRIVEQHDRGHRRHGPRHQRLLLIAAAELDDARIETSEVEPNPLGGRRGRQAFGSSETSPRAGRGPTRPIEMLASTLHSGKTPSFCRSPDTKLAGAARVTAPVDARPASWMARRRAFCPCPSRPARPTISPWRRLRGAPPPTKSPPTRTISSLSARLALDLCGGSPRRRRPSTRRASRLRLPTPRPATRRGHCEARGRARRRP